MAKGSKSKKNKPSRVDYRSRRYFVNKDKKRAKEARRKAFFTKRDALMKEHSIGKNDARKMIRAMQTAGTLDKSISPLRR